MFIREFQLLIRYMKKTFLLIFLLVISLPFCVFSQFSEQFKNKYIQADAYVNEGNFQDALPLFLFLDSINPSNPNINFNIGVCYINSMQDKSKAIPYLEKAIKEISTDYVGLYSETTAPIFAFYYLGKAYAIDYKIDDALGYFDKFKYYLTDNDIDLLADVNRQIEMCYNAKKIMANPVEIKIENLGATINSIYPDYSPVISADESTLIFTSRREGSTGEKKDVDGKYFEDIYIASLKADEKSWTNFRKIGANINSNGHEASISLSSDGKQLFIYQDDNGDGNIYVSNYKNDEWSKPEKLSSEINSKAWETHATLSPDGNTLYFTSNRSGGFGGLDIYMSEKLANGKWAKAINLGAKINTEYDEESPFILPDGVTLYFASKGHESMGGFDVFSSTLSEDGFWSSPENIGYPINTTDDDVFYVPTKDEKHAYYSSAKLGGLGDLDIYKLTIVNKKKMVAILKGIIFDNVSYKPLESKIQITDVSKNIVIASFSSDKTTGDYYVSLPTGKKYKLTVTAEKYIPYEETFEVAQTIDVPEINKAIIMRNAQVVVKEKILFDNKEIVVGERIVLNNVLFDFDKSELREESKVELNKWLAFLKENPTLKIEISGHTDSRGTSAYNDKLSGDRAGVVTDYFISNGIAADRMTFKGYGFTLPIATNLTDLGRQKNRRTEIKITSKY